MPVYLSFSSTMLARPLGSIRGRASSSPEDRGQLVHGQLDLEDVLPGCIAGARARLAVARAADRRADVARALAHSAAVLGPVAELGDLDLRQGDRDELAPGLADQLAVRDVLTQVGLDLAPDDLLEPIGVTIDFSNHGCLVLAPGCRGAARRCPNFDHVVPGRAAHLRSGLSGPPSRKTKDLQGIICLEATGRCGSRTVRRVLCPVASVNDPVYPLANCIP